MTPGPLLPQISPRKFFFRSRTQAWATRRPRGDISSPITPAATSSQSSAPAKFFKRSRDLLPQIRLYIEWAKPRRTLINTSGSRANNEVYTLCLRGDNDIQVQINPAVLPERQIPKYIRHVTPWPLASFQHPALVPPFQRRLPRVALRIDMPDLDIRVALELIEDLPRLIGHPRGGQEQKIDIHVRVHFRC